MLEIIETAKSKESALQHEIEVLKADLAKAQA
jgi:hypothetical protein